MIIAPATLADLDAIDEIERHSFARPWPRSTFEAELTRDIARLEVARLEVARPAAIVGFCNYWIVADPEGRSEANWPSSVRLSPSACAESSSRSTIRKRNSR